LGLTWDALNARWNGWVLGYGPDNQNRFMRWLGMDEPDWRKMVLTLLAILLLLIGGLSLLLFRRYRPPKKDEAALLYRQFIRKLAIVPRPGETPHQYASRIASAGAAYPGDVDAITKRYLAARYGAPDASALPALRSAVRNFRKRTLQGLP